MDVFALYGIVITLIAVATIAALLIYPDLHNVNNKRFYVRRNIHKE
jgi:hypothetical protein